MFPAYYPVSSTGQALRGQALAGIQWYPASGCPIKVLGHDG